MQTSESAYKIWKMQNDERDIKSNKVLPQLVCHPYLPLDQMTVCFETGSDVEERQKGNQV